MQFGIEVAALGTITATERGRILENLMRQVFEASNYQSEPPTRVTGMEIDIPAKHKVTGERIITECKAHRENIPAEVLSKLLGNVTLKKVEAGWLVTTSRLTKDGEGWKQEWEEREPDERRKIQIYTPDRLINLLITSNRIIDPKIIIGVNPVKLE